VKEASQVSESRSRIASTLLKRRTFLKGTAVAGGVAAASQVIPLSRIGGSATSIEPVEELIATACWIGKQECGLLARVVDGRVVGIQGHPDHPRNLGSLCPKGITQITSLYDSARVRTPLIRTNEKGVAGEWRVATWDEALELVAARMKEAKEKDDRLPAYVPGRDKVAAIYDTAFRGATGIRFAYGRRGNDCGGATQDAVLATWGDRGVVSPDLKNCKYLIAYWGVTTSGGPSLCWITYPREMVEAKKKNGMKVVGITPYRPTVAHHADEWVPVRPGTDMAFWLAAINVLLEMGFVDEKFLKSTTNAPSLVDKDGLLVRRDGAPLVWDTKTETAVPYEAATDPALFGAFVVDGVQAKPALQVLKDHVQQYSPEWASEVAGIPAEQIRKVARELGENAMIGSTTVIDGVEVPYRPVAYGLHGTSTKFHSSLQTNRAILLAFMLLGAVEAAGSAQFWNKRTGNPDAVQEGWLKAAAKETPDRLDLGGTKWFPMGAAGYHMFPYTVLEPEKYGLPYRPEDMAVIVHFLNPLITSRPLDRVMEAWQKIGFVAIVTPEMSASANYIADVILPCGTLDKWEGPLGAKTLYESADTIRVPLMQPLGESKSEMEIYADLCEKMGVLYGKDGFIDRMNKSLAIKEDFLLPLEQKPTPEKILDAWSRSKHNIGLDEFRNRGVVAKKVAPDKLYLSTQSPPFNGVRAHFYGEPFIKLAEEMRKRGVPENQWRHATPYPVWTRPVIEDSPAEYDLYLMDFKKIEHKHSRTILNPLLDELISDNPAIMNTRTAHSKGLSDGDEVWVESHNPVSGETRRVKTRLTTRESIRPDSVGLTHHVHDPDEPNVNAILYSGDGFWDIGGSWYSHAKVRVYRA
jgi:sulfite dehydrogenase (quinone) subunit SoeA